MSAKQGALWAAATGASLLLHLGAGMVLYAMPLPASKTKTETEITVTTLATGEAEQAAPLTAIPVAAPVAETLDAATADISPLVGAAPVQAPILEPEQPVTPAPVDATQDIARAVPEPQALASATPDLRPPAATEESPVLPVPDPAPQAASAAEPSEIADQQPAPEAAPHTDATAQATAVEPISAPAATAPEIETVPTRLPPTDVADLHSDDVAVAVSPSDAEVPPVAAQAAAPSPVVASAQPLPTTAGPLAESGQQPAQPTVPSVAPAGEATVAETVQASQAPVAIPSQAIVAPPVATHVAPVEPSAATGGTEVAMIPPTDAPTVTALANPAGAGQADQRSARVRVSEFLVARKDSAQCVLALPTGAGVQEASISAFSDAPEKVAELGDAFERESGLSLRAQMLPVSASQCGTLSFARDLAQYPNFPIRLSLSSQTIGSGEELSGVISGLRKDTLYLMVVDDEGKAELVSSYMDLRSNTMPFRAPMTLTSGPVSSVQLLVAIASDGPLRTIAARPGMPADEYFSRLTTEIVAGNRSIAYGIVGFKVR